MMKLPILIFFFAVSSLLVSCIGQGKDTAIKNEEAGVEKILSGPIKVGAELSKAYFPILKGKRIGLVVNQTSVVGEESLVDYLLSSNIEVKKIFAPEHGFRGNADAGEQVVDGKDIKTGLPIISLYGKNKKPTVAQFSDLDIIVFDIQDVGARFYTYISTMQYVMQTAAEMDLPVLILDRPNPNGHYVDGPILEEAHSSFVGMNPVPIVHGMTVGEYAQMVNGEGWLKNGLKCDLKIIECENYTHYTRYTLPIKPSPNLPNDLSIYLYPSLCLFEGTVVSVGRGTDKQFQIVGYPDSGIGNTNFTPSPKPGASNPRYDDQVCKGYDLSIMFPEEAYDTKRINLKMLVDFYKDTEDKNAFFKPFFTKLAGTKKLQNQIESGMSELDIRDSWKSGLEAFKVMRSKYLIYE